MEIKKEATLMSKIKILPYNSGSKTAKALAMRVGAIRLHHQPQKSKYKGRPEDVIYNYGNGSTQFSWLSLFLKNKRILNDPRAIKIASSKLDAFRLLEDTIKKNKVAWFLPEFTTSKAQASTYTQQGQVVYCRTLTRASEGKGIVVAHNPAEVVSAPLYTVGLEAKREYRAHVFNGEVIDLVAKANKKGDDTANQEIKSHKNGWVFTRNSVTIPDDVQKMIVNCAIETCEFLGIDVAAVDILRTKDNKIYMLEVNTAPGMEGTTLDKYATALLKFHKQVLASKPQTAGGYFV
jgi:glutathione synthase/RimK-type ligase-like ATP-grasp enzyme